MLERYILVRHMASRPELFLILGQNIWLSLAHFAIIRVLESIILVKKADFLNS